MFRVWPLDLKWLEWRMARRLPLSLSFSHSPYPYPENPESELRRKEKREGRRRCGEKQ